MGLDGQTEELQESGLFASEGVGREGRELTPPCPWCRGDRTQSGAGRLHRREGDWALQWRSLPVLSELCSCEGLPLGMDGLRDTFWGYSSQEKRGVDGGCRVSRRLCAPSSISRLPLYFQCQAAASSASAMDPAVGRVRSKPQQKQ